MIIYTLFIFILSCSSNYSNQNKEIVSNKSFELFLKNFKEKSLPIEIIPTLDNEFDFNREIKLSDVKEYLCVDKSNGCLTQPDGGYYQYYYSNFFFIKEANFFIVSCYRVSDHGSDYILTTLNKSGKIIENLAIAGQVDDKSQMESLITDQLDIKTSEVVIFSRISDNVFKTREIISHYKINKDGYFKFLKKEDGGTGTYKFSEHNNRLIKIN